MLRWTCILMHVSNIHNCFWVTIITLESLPFLIFSFWILSEWLFSGKSSRLEKVIQMGFSILVYPNYISFFSWCFICKWLSEDKWDVSGRGVVWLRNPTNILATVVGFARSWDLLRDSPSSSPQRTWPFCQRVASKNLQCHLYY